MQSRQLVIASLFCLSGLTIRAEDFLTLEQPSFDAWTNISPLAETPAPAATFGPALPRPAIESSWYSRIDYFHWSERMEGQNLLTENGPLITIGYLRRVENERFRAEFFDSSVRYKSFIIDNNGAIDPLWSTTNYMGLRGEYDLLYDPQWWPSATLIAGVGTRFWFRDLPDSTAASGAPVGGYLETWWTTYPYLGIQRRRDIGNTDTQLVASGRIGATAATFQHVSWNDVVLYPKLGWTAQLEAGVRGQWYYVSAFSELFTWGQSNVVRDSLQPASFLVTIGLKAGFTY